jgi:hypothetical protein
MIDGGESINPSLVETKPQPNRQESLTKQLEKLDQTRPDHKVFGSFLTSLYQPEEVTRLDEHYSKKTNIRYQPKCALDGQFTPGPFGGCWGIYEYQPITDAVDNLEDNFNIFPNIQEIFKQSEGKSNRDIVKEIAQTITEKTNVPVVFSKSSDKTSADKEWVIMENGNVFSNTISDENVGLHTYIYKGNPEIYKDLEEKGYSTQMDFTPVGDAIIINEASIDKPQSIQTCLHELGHIAEDRFIIPKKEEQYGDKPILDTEVISSLYGLKTCFAMAQHNSDLAFDMMTSPITIYNWTLTGTVAP